MTEKLITKAEMTRLAGVSAAAITKACQPGKRLAPAVVGKRINIDHPAARAYLDTHGNPPVIIPPAPVSEEAPVRGWGARKAKAKANAPEMGPLDIPDDIVEFLDLSLRELIQQFGTDVRFLDWLKATKEIENINEKRLKNAHTRGELVSRSLVKLGILDPIESAHVQLLTDGAKTIARRMVAMHSAERSLEDIEAFVVDQVASFIRPVKARVSKALQNLNRGDHEDAEEK